KRLRFRRGPRWHGGGH
ncbi:hypothetical protein BN1708_019854, partial [Verticillium longisporum]